MQTELQTTPPRTFGRRVGRPLKPNRTRALAHLDTYGLKTTDLAPMGAVDPRHWFTTRPTQIWLEIGFGSGEHLRARMIANPTFGFIGAEPYVNGMSAFLANLPELTPLNLRVYMDDALHILQALKDQTLDGVYILNPDPWPKARHHKRRIIRSETRDLLARVLKPGGGVVLSTDVAELATWMQAEMDGDPRFIAHAAQAANPTTPPTDWPLVTRYMEKGVKAGRAPHYFTYQRVGPAS